MKNSTKYWVAPNKVKMTWSHTRRKTKQSSEHHTSKDQQSGLGSIPEQINKPVAN